jgi:branched-chain amino acid transport system substrate-binding protein
MILWRLLLIFLTFCLVACGSSTKNPIVIGVAAPLSGPLAAVGEDVAAAVRLSVDDLNTNQGGIAGRPVELVEADDEGSPQMAVTVAQKLVNTPGLLGVIGHINSGASLPASNIYHQANVAMITPGSVNHKLTEQGFHNVFRVIGRDDIQATEIAQFIANTLKSRSIAIVHDKTAYGLSIAEYVRDDLKKMGVKVLLFEGITVGDKDFRALLTKIKGQNPDTLFFGGLFTESGLLCVQARQLGLEANYVSGAASKEQGLIDLLGGQNQKVFISGLAEPYNSRFSLRFEKVYHHTPSPLAPYAHDAAEILLASIAQAKTKDRESVSAEVAKTQNFPGLGGPISFDTKGDAVKAPFQFFVIAGNRFVPFQK